MLGWGYVKAPPTHYVLLMKNGKVRREGAGLSVLYFAPTTSLVVVPLASQDAPFLFNETTRDHQMVTVQGNLAFRVADPRRVAELLDFSVHDGKPASDDPAKLAVRIVHAAQTAVRHEVQGRALRDALADIDAIAAAVRTTLRAPDALAALGVELLDFAILALRPVPETARALEAEARERFLREADDAVYTRRNNAVDQERRVRENELATELAVEAKRREIEEAKLARETALEESRRQLVAVQSENTRTLAEAQAFATEAQLKPLRTMDTRALQVLAAGSTEPRLLMAMAFQEIAANAAKVGNLNISPDLLERLLQNDRG